MKDETIIKKCQCLFKDSGGEFCTDCLPLIVLLVYRDKAVHTNEEKYGPQVLKSQPTI